MADVTILHAGPVAKTLDDRPVSVSIRFVNGIATEAEVGMPNGAAYTLTAVAP